ncbi:hypothetical protein PM082_024829 [Marasmius tenuissimus]|nr:hypothetical protein PM082_024829 [Marasmius tenuissimus]
MFPPVTALTFASTSTTPVDVLTVLRSSADCPSTEAFHDSDDFEAQRACQANNAGLQIPFCP